MVRVVAWVCALLCAPVMAQQLGDGHWGVVEISAPNQTLNRYLRLDADAAFGTSNLTVAGDLVQPGDLLLLIRMKQDLTGPDPSLRQQLDLSPHPIGKYAFARAKSVMGNQVQLEAPLLQAFPAVTTQVIVAPEYTSVSVLDGGSITARPWDGFTGGIVALAVQGDLLNDGVVSADSAGYRGATAMPYQSPSLDGGSACTELVDDFPFGSMVGEGIETSWGTRFGRGPAVLGGGGGSCQFGGGAGGSLLGRGGRGGDSRPGLNNGGLEPAAVSLSLTTQLLLGGGGGAGWSRTDYSVASASGARGGGAVLINARSINGHGSFLASGGSPAVFGGGDWGFGGGGAGGSIVLRTALDLTCGAALAPGGQGGRAPNGQGPGGGGGGGLVFLEAGGLVNCPASAPAGVAGVVTQGALPASASDPDYIGHIAVLSPTFDAGLDFPEPDGGAAPTFTSTPNSTGFCGAPYRYSASLVPSLSEPGPYLFALSSSTGALPASLTLDPVSGEILWRPSSAEIGHYDFTLRATGASGVAAQSFSVDVECEGPHLKTVGCSCQTPGSLNWLVWPLGVLLARFRPRRATHARG